ncbi:MAG: hypothetical protein ABIK68_07585 [bacterium]
MTIKTVRSKRDSVIGRRKKRDKKFPAATHEDIEKALEKFMAEGGKITRVEVEWIEEGNIYIGC